MVMFKELTSLLNEVWKFIKSDFHLSSYLFTFFIVGVAVYFNYSWGFYSKVLLNSYFDGTSVWIFPVFYVIVYFSVAIPVVILRKDRTCKDLEATRPLSRFGFIRDKSCYHIAKRPGHSSYRTIARMGCEIAI
jgi:hypothetical protein